MQCSHCHWLNRGRSFFLPKCALGKFLIYLLMCLFILCRWIGDATCCCGRGEARVIHYSLSAHAQFQKWLWKLVQPKPDQRDRLLRPWYGLLRSLTAPKDSKEKSFKELSDLLKAYFESAPIVITKRYTFHRRDQAAGKIIGDYVTELRRLTAQCQFEATMVYFGIGPAGPFCLWVEYTRKRLLKTGLTFSKALETAKRLETSAKDAQQLKGLEQTRTVHNVASQSPKKEACYSCGRTNHTQGH